MSDSMKNRLNTLVHTQYVWAIIAVFGLIVINLINDPTYLQITYSDHLGGFVGNGMDLLRATAPILMVSIGMCLVIATGGIDLSVGAAMVIAGAVTMTFLASSDSPQSIGTVALAILLALLIAAALGVVNSILISVVGLQPFISTLIMMLAGRGIAKVITSGQNARAPSDPYSWLANGYVLALPVVVMISGGIALAVALIVRRSALGMMIEAIGIDDEAARLAGVRRRGILFTVYIASAALAGVAGVLATASVNVVDVSQTGYQIELDAILAVVIGGTSLAGGKFSLRGAAVGALLIATLDKTVVFLGVPSSATPAFKAIVIIILCVVQSNQFRNALSRRRLKKDPQPRVRKEVMAK